MLFSAYSKAQNTENLDFEFPKNRMGQFAKVWFTFINTGIRNEIKVYDNEDEWAEFLSTLSNHSQRVKGITPMLISYVTNNFISIYSKQNNGSWVKVNLGLNASNQITAMGIKKSVKPVAYNLSTNLNKQQVQEIVKDISNKLRHNYVVKKLRVGYSDALTELLNSGKYDSITQGDLLADMLTRDLIKLSADKHLQVIPPSNIKEVIKRFGSDDQNMQANLKTTHKTSLEEGEEKIISSKITEQNIGYIRLSRFVDNESVTSKTRKIFSTLKDTKAIIIDLRYSGGGDARAVNDLLSYFFKKEEFKDLISDSHDSDQINNSAFENELSNTFYQKPLYILTSKKTFSAGEAFVYFLKKQNRATIVGEVTGGGGYRVDAFKLPYDFYFVNSIYTSFDTEKGEGWQGTGIKPDIVTTSKDAFDKVLSIIK